MEKEITTEELTFAAHDKIDALIDLLVEKKLIKENEFTDSLKALYKQMEDSTE